MSKPLHKQLQPHHWSLLQDNNIELMTSHFLKHVTIHDVTLSFNRNIRKPKKGHLDHYITEIVDHFTEIETTIHHLMSSTPLDTQYVAQLFHQWLSNKKTVGQFRSLLHEEEIAHGIHEEFRSLIESNDYPDIFPYARNTKRKIVAYLGDTNSGKTWHALQQVREGGRSAYTAPLRLLALENYNTLNDMGVPTSLITGEEKIFRDDAIATSCTVECFSTDIEYDTVVIDEIQMIDDPQRGSFFIQALVGADAETVVVTGPKEYRRRLEQIAAYLGEEIEVTIFERKTKLTPMRKPTTLKNVKPHTAIIAFSKKELYNIQRRLPKHLSSTLLYGSLGCDVRREQAERFAKGEVDVVITTDCIGMGLNLPIENVLFTKTSKYNGIAVEGLGTMLTKQLAGRAGRYGKFNKGYYGGIDNETHNYVTKHVSKRLKPRLDKRLEVLPPERYIRILSERYKISNILETWADKLKFENGSIFVTTCMENQILIATWLEKSYPVEFKDFWRLIYCPIDFEKQRIEFCDTVDRVICGEPVPIPDFDTAYMGQNDLELLLREINMLRWFCNHYPDNFEDNDDVELQHCVNLINKELNKRLSQ